MARVIPKEFVEKKTTLLKKVADDWNPSGGPAYKVDFKMCQLKQLVWGFSWGNER